MTVRLPQPAVREVYRLEATLGEPLDVGDTAQRHLRIVPLTGGNFTGAELNGTLLGGSSADCQTVLADGTVLVDVRYTLQTDDGDLLYVQSSGARHGSAVVLERIAYGEDVSTEYTFRTSTRIESAARAFNWANHGVFVSVGGRRLRSVIYETYWSDEHRPG